MARVLSGIQPTGEVHLGNYIGALRHWVADQDRHECFFAIVDLHAITVPEGQVGLGAATMDLAATLLSVGIEPYRSTLFVQSHLPEHAELAWVLFCVSTFGELRRMTQFKDKAAKQTEGAATLGFFAYPVLQAADILIYRADRVPVGEDQRQHLELTRDIASRFNQRFGETFVLPEAAVAVTGARIMDLQNPATKMSKSAESPQGTLKVTDPPDTIRSKIRAAVTDSGRDIVYSPEKPAISNLLTIYSVATGKPVQEAQEEYAGKGYAAFKADLADALVQFLLPIRERYQQFSEEPAEIAGVLKMGADRAQAVASQTLRAVYERVGFLPRDGSWRP